MLLGAVRIVSGIAQRVVPAVFEAGEDSNGSRTHQGQESRLNAFLTAQSLENIAPRLTLRT